MIEIWIKKSLSIVKSTMRNLFPQGMTNIVRFTFSVSDTTQAQLVLSKTNRIGDTKHNT